MDSNNATDPYARVKAYSEQKSYLSPISLLQEALVALHISPQYILINTNGLDHTKMFTYEASLKTTTLDISIQGSSKTKKEAKSTAAMNLIKYMCDKADSNCSLSTVSSTIIKCENMQNIDVQHNTTEMSAPNLQSATEYIPVLPINIIGSLQELCVMKGWNHPKYINKLKGGMSHTPVFTTSCSVLDHTVSAIGGNKKTAKKKAAEMMWVHLQKPSLALPSNSLLQPEEIKQEALEILGDITTEENVPSISSSQDSAASRPNQILPLIESISTCSSNESDSVDVDSMCQIQESLESATGPDILKLKIVGISKNVDYKKVLYDLCQEQAIRVGLAGLDEYTDDMQEQCIMQLVFPACKRNITVVFNGVGDSKADAERKAAYNALFFIKMMTNCPKISFKELTID